MKLFFSLLLLTTLPFAPTLAQVELEPWGNLNGIRLHGRFIPFMTSLRVVSGDGTLIVSTARDKQQPRYGRDGHRQWVTTRIDSLYFTEEVEDLGEGRARVHLTCYAAADQHLEGIYFSLQVPVEAGPPDTIVYTLPSGSHALYSGTPTQANIPLHEGDVSLGDTLKATIDLRVSGPVDRAPVQLTVHADHPGRVFDGIGGNFRLQNPRLDPPVIDYNLSHLRVAWGRVELPWRFWQPHLDDHPLDSFGHLPTVITQAMDMAARLSKMGIPIVLSAWSAPDWAVQGTYQPTNNHLDPTRIPDVCKSIADYIACLHDHYGTEVRYFSLNESNIGINVRMTGEEHDAFIKALGAYLASRGLHTKLLLGDNGDALDPAFIQPALADTAARPYIGAVSFHAWRGWDTAHLSPWSAAATQLGVPLLVAEGGIDAGAWRYPVLFQDPSYALKEIMIYTRILGVCQPTSILPWQLTSDYSLLAGNGLCGDNGMFRPTQRFWNLRQLSATPFGLHFLPVSCDRSDIECAALGNPPKGGFAIHIVNNGATCEAFIEGVPAAVKTLRVYVTSATKSMEVEAPLKVVGGKVALKLEEGSFVTLVSQ
ncbi:glycoside hydrolase [Dinghuibacter silviterrae]|uniref:O-glycosyl hydrolase n=1 Tax=Dinghuibacter silviterrae TaxID=1539049 RepID=A0A4R8DH20_9BACT|nr:hypothetical protein [Dinghuibacter silviterrae]TDW96406.1 hypothetical protein EDB95_4235 [Dinghuibacter silviterrae]